MLLFQDNNKVEVFGTKRRGNVNLNQFIKADVFKVGWLYLRGS